MAALKKSRCWRFTLATANAFLPMVMAENANHILWNFNKQLEVATGAVVYASPRAVPKLPLSQWTKTTSTWIEQNLSNSEHIYGRPDAPSLSLVAAITPPEVLSSETYALLEARDKFIEESDFIHKKNFYRAAAERKRRKAQAADDLHTKQFLYNKRMKYNNTKSKLEDIADVTMLTLEEANKINNT